jgi:hypothetical protein
MPSYTLPSPQFSNLGLNIQTAGGIGAVSGISPVYSSLSEAGGSLSSYLASMNSGNSSGLMVGGPIAASMDSFAPKDAHRSLGGINSSNNPSQQIASSPIEDGSSSIELSAGAKPFIPKATATQQNMPNPNSGSILIGNNSQSKSSYGMTSQLGGAAIGPIVMNTQSAISGGGGNNGLIYNSTWIPASNAGDVHLGSRVRDGALSENSDFSRMLLSSMNAPVDIGASTGLHWQQQPMSQMQHSSDNIRLDPVSSFNRHHPVGSFNTDSRGMLFSGMSSHSISGNDNSDIMNGTGLAHIDTFLGDEPVNNSHLYTPNLPTPEAIHSMTHFITALDSPDVNTQTGNRNFSSRVLDGSLYK